MIKIRTFLPTFVIATVLCVSVLGCAPEASTEAAISYPLEICLVSDEKLGEDPDMVPYTFVHEGQEVKLCCKGCLKTFEKEPAKYLAKLQLTEPAPID